MAKGRQKRRCGKITDSPIILMGLTALVTDVILPFLRNAENGASLADILSITSPRDQPTIDIIIEIMKSNDICPAGRGAGRRFYHPDVVIPENQVAVSRVSNTVVSTERKAVLDATRAAVRAILEDATRPLGSVVIRAEIERRQDDGEFEHTVSTDVSVVYHSIKGLRKTLGLTEEGKGRNKKYSLPKD